MEDFARLRLAARPADAGLACARRIRPRTQNDIRLSKTAGFSGTGLSEAGRPRRALVTSRRAASRAARKTAVARGGADRDRTDDLRLAKPALSQLSYSPIHAAPSRSLLARTRAGSLRSPGVWARRLLFQTSRPAVFVAWWAWVDSNYRPPAYQADALTN